MKKLGEIEHGNVTYNLKELEQEFATLKNSLNAIQHTARKSADFLVSCEQSMSRIDYLLYSVKELTK